MTTIDIKEFLGFIEAAPSLPHVFSRLAAEFPDTPVYSQARIVSPERREWIQASYRQVSRRVWRLAQYLKQRKIGPGDRVAIVSFTRPEWLLADLAILYLGAVSVSVYQSLNPQEMGYILFDAGVKFVFAENEEQTAKLEELQRSPCDIPATEERPAQSVQLKFGDILTFERVEGYRSLWEVFDTRDIPESEPELPPSPDVASLVYTSGTTGPPKGVIQSHRNHLANLRQAAQTGLFAPDGDIFLFLPLAHSFARLIGYIGFLTPTVVKFPAVVDPRSSALNAPSILRDLREEGAQVVPMVPRILEKLMNGVQEKLRGSGLAAKILAAAVQSQLHMFEARRDKRQPEPKQMLLAMLTKPVSRKLKRQLFGDRFRHVVSGGAKLPVSVNEFFSSLGITIFEGYGLTETCVATNVNRLERNKIGSVGPCLPDVEIRIAEDGEILFRGPNIARGYFGREAATKAAWDNEGWFHTGDLGRLDEDGFLYITGRKKELIVTSGGKKISPLMIEEKLSASPFISSAILVGDAKPYCSALIVLDVPIMRQWAARKGLSLTDPLSIDPSVRQRISAEIDHINETLSRYETIKRFAIIDQEFTVENGFLTPTFKVKRDLVQNKFAHVIAGLYDEASS